jgi:hypothetical protein
MKLYVCWGTWKGATPRPFRRAESHPCGAAHKALLTAGYDPDVVRCFGWEALPTLFNLTSGRREVRRLTGQVRVPVLVTEEDEVVAGSSEIAVWARRNPATPLDGLGKEPFALNRDEVLARALVQEAHAYLDREDHVEDDADETVREILALALRLLHGSATHHDRSAAEAILSSAARSS